MNIIHGHAAAGSFKQAFHIPGEEILVFTDVLSCGPLEAFTGIDVWKKFREEFWSNLGEDNTFEFGAYAFSEFQRDFYENFNELYDCKEIKLWLGTGLSDQLLLVFFIHILDEFGFDLNRLEIFQFDKIAGENFEIQSLGLLNPDQIKNHPKPYTPNIKLITTAKLAWQAVSDCSPDAYLQFIASDHNNMPLLSRALKSLIFRYPKSSNGLSFWDEKLLQYTEKQGPKATKIIAYTLGHTMGSLDLVGDYYLFSRLKQMGKSHLAVPLIEANALDLPMRDTQIQLTSSGKQALRDQLNVISLNGIDDWVGGVHLDSSTGSVWLQKNETLFCQKL